MPEPGTSLSGSRPDAPSEMPVKAMLFTLVLFCASATSFAQNEPKTLPEAMEIATKALAAEKFEEADNALAAVKAAANKDPKALVLWAKVAAGLGDFVRGSGLAGGAVKLDAKFAEGWQVLGECFLAAGEQAMNDGRSSMGRVENFFTQAVDAFDRAAKEGYEPKDAAYQRKGNALWFLSKFPEASKAFEECAKLRPDDAQPLLWAAQAEKAAANMTRAAEFAAKGFSAKNLPIDDAKALASLILEVNGPQKKFAETVEAYQKWADIYPKSEVPLNWIAHVRTLEKRYDEAIVIFTKAFDLSGKSNANTALDLGKAFGSRGDVKAAVGWFKKAHELRKTWDTPADQPIAQVNFFVFQMAQNRQFAEAIELMEKECAEMMKNDFRSWSNLGLYWRDWADSTPRSKAEDKLARNKKALAAYEKAEELCMRDPLATATDKALVLNDLGVIHDYNLGDMAKGFECYKRAVAADPNYVDACENMGLCLNKLGKHEEAIPYFDRVLAQQPNRRVSLGGKRAAEAALKKQ